MIKTALITGFASKLIPPGILNAVTKMMLRNT